MELVDPDVSIPVQQLPEEERKKRHNEKHEGEKDNAKDSENEDHEDGEDSENEDGEEAKRKEKLHELYERYGAYTCLHFLLLKNSVPLVCRKERIIMHKNPYCDHKKKKT